MNLGETTTKALLTGAVAAAGSTFLFGEYGTSNVAGIQLPSFVVVGGSAALGSWASDAFSDTVIKMIPQNANWASAESLVVRLGLAGATTAGALKFGAGLPNGNIPLAIGLGAASKASGEWLSANVVKVGTNLLFA
jgi:hypothetical protein